MAKLAVKSQTRTLSLSSFSGAEAAEAVSTLTLAAAVEAWVVNDNNVNKYEKKFVLFFF